MATLFSTLYDLSTTLSRSGGTISLVVGNGILTDSQDPNLMFPLITSGVTIQLDPSCNCISLVDNGTPTCLDTTLLSKIPNFHGENIPKIQARLEQESIYPWDRESCELFLPYLANAISTDCGISNRFTMLVAIWQSHFLVALPAKYFQ